jgi:hypothetical protein
VISDSELSKASSSSSSGGGGSFIANMQFGGVKVREWTPPEEGEEDSKVSRISYISSVGPGIVKIKVPENLLLPLAYQKHLNLTGRLLGKSKDSSLNEFGLDDSSVSVKAISNQADKELFDGLSIQFTAI